MNKDSFEEYIRHIEPDKAEKDYAWQTATGLEEERRRIAEITVKMMTLFEERQRISLKIAEIKRREGLPTEDAEREKELLAKYAGGDAQKERLLKLLFALSKEEQEKSRK